MFVDFLFLSMTLEWRSLGLVGGALFCRSGRVSKFRPGNVFFSDAAKGLGLKVL